VVRKLRAIYTAPDKDAALKALAAFVASPLGRYPRRGQSMGGPCEAVTPFLAFSPPLPKLLYTANGIESLDDELRKFSNARGHFPLRGGCRQAAVVGRVCDAKVGSRERCSVWE
jgi:putative transposase